MKKLVVPGIPVHDWHKCDDFLKIEFQRKIAHLFDPLHGNNTNFGLQLVNALYSAEHGDLELLRFFLAVPHPDPECRLKQGCQCKAHRVLRICCSAEDAEAEPLPYLLLSVPSLVKLLGNVVVALILLSRCIVPVCHPASVPLRHVCLLSSYEAVERAFAAKRAVERQHRRVLPAPVATVWNLLLPHLPENNSSSSSSSSSSKL